MDGNKNPWEQGALYVKGEKIDTNNKKHNPRNNTWTRNGLT